jgi:hypothetical protein
MNDYIVQLPDGLNPQVQGEPNGDLICYVTVDNRIKSYTARLEYADYANLTWVEDSVPRITSRAVKRFATKGHRGHGAMSAYVRDDDTAGVLTPVNRVHGLAPPSIEVGQTDTQLTFAITNHEIELYEKFRFHFRHIESGWIYDTFTTRELSGTFEKPPDMQGVFEVWVVGTRRGVQEHSRASVSQNIIIRRRYSS